MPKTKNEMRVIGQTGVTVVESPLVPDLPSRPPLKYADLPLISIFPPQQFTSARDLLEELEMIKDSKKRIEDREKEILVELEQVQKSAPEPIRGFRYGQLAFAAEEMEGRETLNKEALLMAGVSIDQIKAGMKKGKGFVQRNFKVLASGEKGEEVVDA
jgi:hypothetical protein